MTNERAEQLTLGRQMALQALATIIGGLVVFLLMRLMGEGWAYSARFAIIWSALMLVLFAILGAVKRRRRSSSA